MLRNNRLWGFCLFKPRSWRRIFLVITKSVAFSCDVFILLDNRLSSTCNWRLRVLCCLLHKRWSHVKSCCSLLCFLEFSLFIHQRYGFTCFNMLSFKLSFEFSYRNIWVWVCGVSEHVLFGLCFFFVTQHRFNHMINLLTLLWPSLCFSCSIVCWSRKAVRSLTIFVLVVVTGTCNFVCHFYLRMVNTYFGDWGIFVESVVRHFVCFRPHLGVLFVACLGDWQEHFLP